jgi:signal transduction histidine kinase
MSEGRMTPFDDSFYDRLFDARSLAEAATIAAGYLGTRKVTNVLVCLLSGDGKALVVRGAWPPDSPILGRRVLLSADPHFASVLAPVPTYSLSDQRTTVEPWMKRLGVPSSNWVGVGISGPYSLLGTIVVMSPVGRRGLATLARRALAVAPRLGRVLTLSQLVNDHASLLGAEESFHTLDERVVNALESVIRSEPVDTSEIFALLASSIVSITQADVCDISLQADGIWTPVAKAGKVAGLGKAASPGDSDASESLSLQAVDKRAPVFLFGRRTDRFAAALRDALSTPHDKDLFDSLRAWGAFPILTGDNAVGVVSVASTHWDFFSAWRQKLLRVFARRASLILSVDRAMSKLTKQRRERDDSVGRLTLEMNRVATNVGYAEAARTVVHNLGNMFTPLGSNVEAITQWARTKKPSAFPTQRLEQLSRQLTRVERVFTTYQRLRTPKPLKASHELAQLVVDAVEFCRARAERSGVSIDIRDSSNKARVMASDAELLQAFNNVVVNAVDSMSSPDSPGRHLLIRIFVTDDNVVASFEDRGVGIPAKHLKKVFKPGYTTKALRGGTGLGLAHVRAAAVAAGGTVELDSRVDKGTTVRMSLPLQKGLPR